MNYNEFLNFCITQKIKRTREGIDPTFIVMNKFSFDILSDGLIKNDVISPLKILISENLKNHEIKIG